MNESITEMMETLADTFETPMVEQMMFRRVAKDVRANYNKDAKENAFFEKLDNDRLSRELREENKYLD